MDKLIVQRRMNAEDIKERISGVLKGNIKKNQFKGDLRWLFGNAADCIFVIPEMVRNIVLPMDMLMNSHFVQLHKKEIQKHKTKSSEGQNPIPSSRNDRSRLSHFDDFEYFYEARKTQAYRSLFRISFEESKQTVHIRNVTKDIDQFPEMEVSCPRRTSSSPFFLRRNLRALTFKTPHKWPRYVLFSKLDYTIQGNKVSPNSFLIPIFLQMNYHPLTEHWMVNLNRTGIDPRTAEKKTIQMLEWVEKRRHERF